MEANRWRITEGNDGPSLGTSSVVIIYIGYIYVIYRYICGNVGEVLIRLIGRRVKLDWLQLYWYWLNEILGFYIRTVFC